jgi:ABC-type dipeptide/oligopeptide/nickel transport system ATPase subunit
MGLKEELLGRYSFQLSGGECQRVCIARSIILEPKLLVCDEITSALDTKTQKQILSIIRRMSQKYDFSLICISHDLTVISQITDQIILLDEGKIIESAPTGTFLSAPESQRGKKILQAFATLQ